MASVNYFVEDVDFKIVSRRKMSKWIKESITSEDKQIGEISFIFCSDQYLNQINIEFLNHTDFTDIITFNQSESATSDLTGDIYISIERVGENSIKFGTPFEEELNRVMIHGIMHLVGYNDKTKNQKRQMREKEDTYLNLRY